MADLVRDAANDTANPRVLFAWQAANIGETSGRGGFFQPLSALSFRILRPDGSQLVAPTVVDVDDQDNQLDRIDGGGAGRIFILPFTVDAVEPLGLYTAEVTFTAAPEGGTPLAPQTTSFQFRVLDEAFAYIEGAYAQIQDMLDAGFPVGNPAPCGGYSEADAARALARASDYVEMVTARFFSPRYLAHDYDGRGGPLLQTGHVIVGLTAVGFTFTTFSPADLPIEEGDLRVYNRHIRQGLLAPDDRQDPRVEFLRTATARFPRDQLLGDTDMLSAAVGFVDSQQNVVLRGVWGYTDPDGSPFGKTPALIVEATLRLAARYIQPLWKQLGGAGGSTHAAGPVVSEKTLDQSVTFANLAGSGAVGGYGAFAGAFTGDPEIDQILAAFMAPPRFGSA